VLRSAGLLGACVLIVLAGDACPVRAEKELSSPAELQKIATHIIVGKVRAVYTRKENSGNWGYIRYVAEVQVLKGEKGEGVKKGDLLYARYYTMFWRGKGRPKPFDAGHFPKPEAGQAVRIYLARNAYDGYTEENNDGGFNVVGVNGFVILKRKTGK
jgi:hypothetical protein